VSFIEEDAEKLERRIPILSRSPRPVGDGFRNTKALRMEGSRVSFGDIAGAGFEPATFGL
jgi:hypothetical protein